MALEIYNSYMLYDTAKGLTKDCLKKYDSYFMQVYNSTTSANRSDYKLYCGNLKKDGTGEYFSSYEIYSIFFDTSGTSTFNVKYSHSSKSDIIKISSLNNSGYFRYSNIKSFKLPNILALEEQTSSTSAPTQDLPFNREEFFIIPFLLCILILMLFLKWCFPMKGGKDLR